MSPESIINEERYNNKCLMDREQVGGDHYNNKKIQPIDYIIENSLPYCEGNVVKYVTRHKEKNGAEDIRKAIHYLRFILAADYGEKL
jgi:hypothetical protein